MPPIPGVSNSRAPTSEPPGAPARSMIPAGPADSARSTSSAVSQATCPIVAIRFPKVAKWFAPASRSPTPTTPRSFQRPIFSTHFTYYGDAAHSVLLLQTLVDDGAIFYLNGTEIARLGMPFIPAFNATLANRTVGNAGFEYLTNSGGRAPARGQCSGSRSPSGRPLHSGHHVRRQTFRDCAHVGLGVTVSGGNMNLLWMPAMNASSADEVSGPWSDVVPSSPPNRHSEPIAGSRKFYRIVAPAP